MVDSQVYLSQKLLVGRFSYFCAALDVDSRADVLSPWKDTKQTQAHSRAASYIPKYLPFVHWSPRI